MDEAKGTKAVQAKKPTLLKNRPTFIPHRKKNRSEHPKPPTHISASASTNPNAPTSALFGRDVAEALSYLRSNPHLSSSVSQYPAESMLRGADYLNTPLGTNEDLVYRRRAMMELGQGVTVQERKKWEQELEALIHEEEDREYAQLENYNTDAKHLREEDMAKDIWSREDGVVQDKVQRRNLARSGYDEDEEGTKEPWSVQDLGKDDGDDSGVDRKELVQNQKAFGPWYVASLVG